MRAELVTILIICHVFPKRLLALLAQERHLVRLREPVVLCLRVALGAVEPLPAARCADGDLGIEDVFADRATLSIRCTCVAVGSSGRAISSDGWDDDDDGAFTHHIAGTVRHHRTLGR